MRNRILKISLIFITGWGINMPPDVPGQVTPTNIWSDFYSDRTYLNGARAAVGSVVQAYDRDGILCGEFIVVTPGLYGYLHVYGDEPETDTDEGAVEGDSISFTIDGQDAVSIGNVVWIPGNPGGVFRVDLYVGGFPPIIENFPEQISLDEDDSVQISLNDYVYDENNSPEELTWTARTISGITISIDINPSTKIATLSADPDSDGNATVRFKTTDPDGFSDSIDVSIIVNPINDPPVITSPAAVTAFEDEPFVYLVRVKDLDGPILRITFENLSDWLSASGDSVFGTPTEGITYGEFRVIASDSFFSDTLDVAITVIPVNDAPLAFALISPADGDTVDSLIIQFLWRQSFDVELQPVEYIFHLSGTHMDTAITGLSDTSFVFDGSYSLKFDSLYVWYVEATDGIDTTSSITRNQFRTPLPVGVYVDGSHQIPDKFFLNQNYPNPFNPSTTIEYGLPVALKISLIIYDFLGHEVIRLIDEEKPAGYHHVVWNGRNRKGNRVASGIYIYKMVAKGSKGKERFLMTKRVLLLK